MEDLVVPVVKLTHLTESMQTLSATASARRSARMEVDRIMNENRAQMSASTTLPTPTTTRMIKRLTGLNLQIQAFLE